MYKLALKEGPAYAVKTSGEFGPVSHEKGNCHGKGEYFFDGMVKGRGDYR